jgi:hypothetical protein
MMVPVRQADGNVVYVPAGVSPAATTGPRNPMTGAGAPAAPGMDWLKLAALGVGVVTLFK